MPKRVTQQEVEAITVDPKYITTEEIVAVYEATHNIFAGLIKEMRELSRKKPDATLNQRKVKTINRALEDLRIVLKNEPEFKFLDLLDDEELPQTSDAVLVMVQYESTLEAFKDRHYRTVRNKITQYHARDIWVTEPRIASLANDEVLK